MTLVLQGALALVMVAAALFTLGAPRTSRLYAWSAVIPVGFAVVFWRAHARGERARASGAWTLEWERSEARRAFQLLGAVAALWALGVAVVALF